MKKRTVISIFLVLLFFMVGACSKPSMVITEIDNGKVKNIKVGSIVKIKLKVQPGTGFSWHIAPKMDGIKLIKDIGFEGTSENLPGGYEYQSYLVKLINTGKINVELKLNRSWETSSDDEKKFNIIFAVSR